MTAAPLDRPLIPLCKRPTYRVWFHGPAHRPPSSLEGGLWLFRGQVRFPVVLPMSVNRRERNIPFHPSRTARLR